MICGARAGHRPRPATCGRARTAHHPTAPRAGIQFRQALFEFLELRAEFIARVSRPVRLAGPGRQLQRATSTFCWPAKRGTTRPRRRVTTMSTAAITHLRPSNWRAVHVGVRRALAILRQLIGVDLLEIAHAAQGRESLFGHQSRGEIVRSRAKDGGLVFGVDGLCTAFEAERVLQDRAHFVGHVAHRGRTFASLLGQQPGDQQLEPRRNRLPRLDCVVRVRWAIFLASNRDRTADNPRSSRGQRAQSVDVVGGARRLIGELLRARRNGEPEGHWSCRPRRRQRRNPRAAGAPPHPAGCWKA